MPHSQQKTITLPYNYTPRDYQIPLWQYMDTDTNTNTNTNTESKRAFQISHRRSGKDLNIWNLVIKESQKRVGTYWYLFPELKQGRKALFEARTSDGTAFLDFIPKELILGIRDNDMLIKLTNGSTIQILGSDRFDSLVGSNPVGVVFSEFALSNPAAWLYISPILAANGGWAIFNTTPRGMNHAYDLFKTASKNPNWFCQLLTIDDTRKKVYDSESKTTVSVPVISKEAIEEERLLGTPEEHIQQEYYCSFTSGQVGSYYSEAMARAQKEDRISSSLSIHNPEYPVYTAWDIGISDATSIWYYQFYNNKVHVIEYNEFEGRSMIESAAMVLGNFNKLAEYRSAEEIAELSQKYAHHTTYKYADHFAPHDIRKRDQGTGMSTLTVARNNGILFRVIPIHRVLDGINTVRKILPHTIFCRAKCEQGISCLRDYKKRYDSKNKLYLDEPLHDWASHGADAFRYLSASIITFIDKKFIEKASRVLKNASPTAIHTLSHIRQQYEQRLQHDIERIEKRLSTFDEQYVVKD